MSEWKEYQLDEVIEKFIDYRGKTPKKVELGVPLITAKVIKDGIILPTDEFIELSEYSSWMTRGLPKVNDVLLTTEAPLGEVALVRDSNIALAQRVILLRGKSNVIDNNFLFYSLRTEIMQHRLLARASGSTVQGIKSAELKKILISLPSINTQKKISQALSCLDRKIENLRRQNETLERIAQTLFKHWFVDFEFPNEDGKPYKSSGGAMVRSDLGEIPADWHVSRIERIAERIAMGPFGSRITTDNFVDSGVPVIRGSNLVNGFDEKNFVYLTEEKADELKSSNAFPEDIVFTHRGTLGQVGFIPTYSQYPRYVVSQSQMLLSVNKNLVSSRYVYRFFCSKAGMNKILANTNTTGVPSIGRPTTTLKGIEMVLPKKNILWQFDSLVKALDFKKEANDKQSQTLIKTRDSLLHQLMSGKLRIIE